MYPDRAQSHSSTPRIGVVITTFGAPAYIELQLALLTRYPSLRALIVDDASDQVEALESVARRYGADLFVNDVRLGHLRGDLSGFATGLDWAAERQLTHLVKFSRRFIPYFDWLDNFQSLLRTRPKTIGNWCQAHNFFRTEAFAVEVAAWMPALKHLQNTAWVYRAGGDVIERYIHVLARGIANDHRRPQAFERWPLLGSSRARLQPGVLWHDVNATADYVTTANVIGLPLTFEDFESYTAPYRNAATPHIRVRERAA